ncbi:MAG: TonB-dependent receptor, partial [Bacteroidota bacterium]
MKFNANPRQLLLLFCFFLCLIPLQAQEETAIIRGSVKNQAGESLVASRVYLEGTDFGAMSDEKGFFEIQGVTAGSYRLAVSRIGSESYVQEIVVSAGQTLRLKVRLTGKDVEMDEVEIEGETQSSLLEKQGFSVEAIDTRQLQIQSIDINRVLDRTAGVRVRRSGGMGSDFIYSLNGMTGNAIRFFIDGVPMDYFGSSYSINNFPTTLLERVEIYKGVVPVSLGSDALGGVVNLVTDQTVYNFLEASYSFGSFNTHQAVVSGQWKAPNSGLTTRLSAFYNYSDNDYGVWGRGVTYATPETGFRPIEFTEEDPAIRFNDDFRTANAKVDIGFTNQSWADQIFVGAVISDLDRGIQHGQTMGTVFGDIRYTENFLMPFLTYRKEDLGIKGLNTDFFLSLAMKEGINTDTSTNRYDWRGEVININ